MPVVRTYPSNKHNYIVIKSNGKIGRGLILKETIGTAIINPRGIAKANKKAVIG